MFIDDQTIYSYGHHWPIATRVGNDDFVLNKSKYSISTSQQTGKVRSALGNRILMEADTRTIKKAIDLDASSKGHFFAQMLKSFGEFFQRWAIDMEKDLEIVIVDDEPCPKCGAVWGHSDPNLDYPNRPKVQHEDGVWWWKCYNPKCDVKYYDPETETAQFLENFFMTFERCRFCLRNGFIVVIEEPDGKPRKLCPRCHCSWKLLGKLMFKIKPEIEDIQKHLGGITLVLNVNGHRVELDCYNYGMSIKLSIDGVKFSMNQLDSPDFDEIFNFFANDSYTEFLGLAGYGSPRTKTKQLNRVLRAKKTNREPKELADEMLKTFFRSISHRHHHPEKEFFNAVKSLEALSSKHGVFDERFEKLRERRNKYLAEKLHSS